MVFLVVFAGSIAIALAILLPGRTGRGRRLKRVFAAASAFVLAEMVSTAIAVLSGSGDDPGFWPLSLVGWAVTFAVTAIPFGLADRLAGWLGAHRTILWAVPAVAAGLAWSATIQFLILRHAIGTMGWHGLLLDFALPGIAAGLAWYAWLPRGEPPVGQVFD